MNRPTLVRAVPVPIPDLRAPLRDAINTIARLTNETARLRAEIADRDEKIATLQGMNERAQP